MKNSQKGICCAISLIRQNIFHNVCRDGDLSSFIRNRKMPLLDLLLTTINRRGITLRLELSKPGYDVMNRMILESNYCNGKFDEMCLAEEWIDRVCNTIGASQLFLVVMDKGYLPMEAFIQMMGKSIFFLVRLESSDYKKEESILSKPDTWVAIHLDKSSIIHNQGTDISQRMEEIGHIKLRVRKVSLPEE